MAVRFDDTTELGRQEQGGDGIRIRRSVADHEYAATVNLGS